MRKEYLKTHDDEILGNVEYHYEFFSRYLRNERDIIVWLPNSYYSNSHKRYSVLYMHDGQNLFNPATSFAGFDWKVDETALDLIERKITNEFIVVGIYNTKDRLEEYNYYSPKGKNYAYFLINELKPFIDEHYHTYPSKYNTAVMGSSLGGLISFQLIWNFPGIFGMAACLSSSFWFNDRLVFRKVENSQKPNDIKIYLDCGSLEKELIEDSKNMYKLLLEKGFTENKDVFWHEEPNGKHREQDWAKRLFIPLSVLFGY